MNNKLTVYFSTFLLMVLLCISSTQASARPIVADLSVRSIDIDHDFTGIDVLLFGAKQDPGDIVVVVRGPEKPHVVRKKERFLGVWANRESVSFNNVYQYYSVAATKPLDKINNQSLLDILAIGVEGLSPASITTTDDIDDFKKALIKQKQESNLYSNKIEKISFWGETLFRTVLKFPKNIPGGTYTVETYLFSDGQLNSMQVTPIHVSKIGFEEFMYGFAHNRSLLYGVLAIALAAAAGYVASWVFRRY